MNITGCKKQEENPKQHQTERANKRMKPARERTAGNDSCESELLMGARSVRGSNREAPSCSDGEQS